MAIVIGSVRSAQKVKIQEVATMTDFSRARPSRRPPGCSIGPTSRKQTDTATNAAPPKNVEHSSVGSTALSRTLAFFARS